MERRVYRNMVLYLVLFAVYVALISVSADGLLIAIVGLTAVRVLRYTNIVSLRIWKLTTILQDPQGISLAGRPVLRILFQGSVAVIFVALVHAAAYYAPYLGNFASFLCQITLLTTLLVVWAKTIWTGITALVVLPEFLFVKVLSDEDMEKLGIDTEDYDYEYATQESRIISWFILIAVIGTISLFASFPLWVYTTGVLILACLVHMYMEYKKETNPFDFDSIETFFIGLFVVGFGLSVLNSFFPDVRFVIGGSVIVEVIASILLLISAYRKYRSIRHYLRGKNFLAL